MEQNTNSAKNKITDFLQKNKNYVIAGIIVILAIVYFSTRGNSTQSEEQTSTPPPAASEQQQTDEENENNEATAASQPAPASDGSNSSNASEDTNGNVTATGTLTASDNASKGNLMIQSNRGKIYISTRRDFSSLIGKEVTLNASGTINNFVFLGLTEGTGAKTASVSPAPAPAHNTTDAVHFTGILAKSDNTSRGNYVITSGKQKVYLQSKRDYSAWEGQQVHLKATGTIQSFTNAVLTK